MKDLPIADLSISMKIKTPLSKGKLIAGGLMLVSHIDFAVSSLLLVMIFTLVARYIGDKGGSICFLIILKHFANFIHLILALNIILKGFTKRA